MTMSKFSIGASSYCSSTRTSRNCMTRFADPLLNLVLSTSLPWYSFKAATAVSTVYTIKGRTVQNSNA